MIFKKKISLDPTTFTAFSQFCGICHLRKRTQKFATMNLSEIFNLILKVNRFSITESFGPELVNSHVRKKRDNLFKVVDCWFKVHETEKV